MDKLTTPPPPRVLQSSLTAADFTRIIRRVRELGETRDHPWVNRL